MRRIFRVDTSLCVECRACVAACSLENGMGVKVRNLHTVNNGVISNLPLFTLSLACNHCETAACMDGCPSKAYYRDDNTGAVIIDGSKCIGCGYCTWNCAYGAPVLNESKGFIEKCTFCNHLISEGFEPACSVACPTGALGFLNDSGNLTSEYPKWFPEKELSASIIIRTDFAEEPVQIIPDQLHKDHRVASPRHDAPNQFRHFWPLAVFTLAASFACGIAIASLTGFRDSIMPISSTAAMAVIIIILAAGSLFSLFHLKNKKLAWRSLLNVSESPLSREILFFILLGISSVLGIVSRIEVFTTVSGILALFLLITIDSVYTNADKRNSIVYHSGQLFLSGFTISAVMAGLTIVFIIVAAIRVGFSIKTLMVTRGNRFLTRMTCLRILLLLFLTLMLTDFINSGILPIMIILFAGELVDRILYYLNFRPIHISETFEQYLTQKINEKTRN